MTDIERIMAVMQATLSSTSVTIDQYREAILLSATADTSRIEEPVKKAYCDACVSEMVHLMEHTAPSEDDPKAFCLDLIQLQLTLHLSLYPNYVSPKFMVACAALAEFYPLSVKAFADPVLEMAANFHALNPLDWKQIGFGRRRQVSALPKHLQDLCLVFYSEASA